jgi:hypothetical protein
MRRLPRVQCSRSVSKIHTHDGFGKVCRNLSLKKQDNILHHTVSCTKSCYVDDHAIVCSRTPPRRYRSRSPDYRPYGRGRSRSPDYRRR